MKLQEDDKQILQNLCSEYDVKYEKILQLLETEKDYQFKDRRIGIYEALKTIIKQDIKVEEDD